MGEANRVITPASILEADRLIELYQQRSQTTPREVEGASLDVLLGLVAYADAALTVVARLTDDEMKRVRWDVRTVMTEVARLANEEESE